MSVWVELLNSTLQIQDEGLVTCDKVNAICDATAFNPIAAAFATQGYFVQADMLYYITSTTFGTWAPFLYLIAAIGGLFSLALGAPPKMYLWFFVGPGIYTWLVETRLPSHGVQWQVGNVPQDQRAVWRLAHIGIKNSGVVARMAGKVPGTAADPDYELLEEVSQSTDKDGWCKPTKDPVYVSNFFLRYDMLVSYAVERLVGLTGINRTSDIEDHGSHALEAKTGASAEPNRWYLISDKKWALLDTITAARLSSAPLRDAFVTFLSSECGDALNSEVDQASFVQAANSESGNTPCTVMRHDNYKTSRSGLTCDSDTKEFYESDYYQRVWNKLRTKTSPSTVSVRRVFQDEEEGSFIYYLNGAGSEVGTKLAKFYKSNDYAECHQNFYTLVQGFRWEASQIYSQLIRSGPVGLSAHHVLTNLFYGWSVRSKIGRDLVKPEEMEQWTRDLILVHLFRNELAIAPKVADKKFTHQTTLDSYSQNFTAQTGAKTKYGEVYAWARMVPYMQGVMLYLLALAYPFACMMLVMPGWHKTLFTWMSFWAWVKLWDAGFAVVTQIERSVWAMLGNGTKLNYTSPLIYQMKNWGASELNLPKNDDGTPILKACPVLENAYCFMDLQPSLTCNLSDSFIDANSGGTPWWHTAAIFDRALTLASSIDLDVANGYYIYLMSALYFAVPAATGQLVLGAKAGVSGMVNGLVQGIQQDGGRGASGGFLGNFRGQAAAGAAAMRQESHARGLAAGGYASKAFGQANSSLQAGLDSGAAETANRQMGLKGQSLGTAQSALNASSQAIQQYHGAGHIAGGHKGMKAAAALNGGNFMDMSKAIPNEALSQIFGVNGNPEGGANVAPVNSSPNMKGGSQGGTGAQNGSQQAGTGSQDGTGGVGGFVRGAVGNFNNIQALGQMAWGPGQNFRNAANAAGHANVSSQWAQSFGASQANLNSSQAANNISGFAASSAREAYGIGERRYSAAADFGGQTSTFNASVGLSDHAAGYIGSLGGDASVVSPTSKPTDMTGMAMSGRLGMANQQSSNWAMGGFHNVQGATVDSLNSNYGSSYVQSGWTTPMSNLNDYGKITGEVNKTASRIMDDYGRKD